MHLTAEIAFKEAEMNNMTKHLESLEAEKKNLINLQKEERKSKEVISKNKSIEELNDTDLKTLFGWYCIQGTSKMNLDERRGKWKKMVDKNTEPPTPCN